MSENSSAPPEDAPLLLETFRATISPVTAESLPHLHELAVSVFWPHRGRDIELFLELGQGYIAHDEIGRAMGSAMYFPMGEDFAMLGMMIVTPRLQGNGAGRRLLERVLKDCEGRDLRITATLATRAFYASAGLEPVCNIAQHQGFASAVPVPKPVPGLLIRPLEVDDLDAVRQLDTAAYGADRTVALDALLRRSEGLVAVRDGAVRGFALKRPFGRGVVVGPLVAEDDAMAEQLAAPLIRASEGAFVRVDAPVAHEAFRALLSAANLGVYDTVTEMRRGPARRATTGPQVHGLATHSLG